MHSIVYRHVIRIPRRCTRSRLLCSSTTTPQRPDHPVDLRSDTVTQPSRAMLQTALTAPTGDDVYGEDPTVRQLEDMVAALLGKDHAIYVPTGTMANLIALSAHCDRRATELIMGSHSHICRYEGGNTASAASIPTRQVPEDPATAEFDLRTLAEDVICDSDDNEHYCRTAVVCVENTHNILGGIPLSLSYLQQLSTLCQSRGVAVHMDGARLAHAVAAAATTPHDDDNNNNTPWHAITTHCDTITLCLSKGLGAPLGSVVVSSDPALTHRARRARKRYGGGMRQAGVVAAMGVYAIQHHTKRVQEDHRRAQALAQYIQDHGFTLLLSPPPTNLVFCGLPGSSQNNDNDPSPTAQQQQQQKMMDAYVDRLANDYGVLVGGGYRAASNQLLLRAVTHLDIDDADIAWAQYAMVDAWNRMDKGVVP